MSAEKQKAVSLVFPSDPQDAQITFTITVEEIQGEGLLLGATLDPGGAVWDHETVSRIFAEARVEPVPGEYLFCVTKDGITYGYGPDMPLSFADSVRLVRELEGDLTNIRGELVTALVSFPNDTVLGGIADVIIRLVAVGSLKRDKFSGKPVADARLVKIEGVHCATRSFGMAFGLQELLGSVSGGDARDENIQGFGEARFVVSEEDPPTVRIGYLSRANPFAPVFNRELAVRVHETIMQVAEAVILDMVAQSRVRQRLFQTNDLAMLVTYAVDPIALEARVDALEAEARAELADVEPVNDEPDDDGSPVDLDYSDLAINDQPD